MSENKDLPDTPPEVLARQARQRPLTQQTAELIGAKEYVDEGGRLTDGRPARINSAAASARQRAQAYAGGSPHFGLSVERVMDIMGRAYPDAPPIDPELGDRTPEFVNWLWAKHPADARVRYTYRDIWPTTLPADWNPATAPAIVTPTASVTVTSGNAPTVESVQAELDRTRAELAALKAKGKKKPVAKKPSPAPSTAATA